MPATFKRSNERGNNLEHKKAGSIVRRLRIWYIIRIFGCGGRIWTCDLQVMSLTKFLVFPKFSGKSQKDRKCILPMQTDRKKIANRLRLGLFFHAFSGNTARLSKDLMPPSPKSESIKVISSSVWSFGSSMCGNQMAVAHSLIGIIKNCVAKPSAQTFFN